MKPNVSTIIKNNPLDPFYPVFDSVEWLCRLLPLGIKLVQLRIKSMPETELRKQILLAKDLTEKANCQLVLNDYWELAIELGCDFIHLGQEDLDVADIDSIRQAKIKIGISTHSKLELERALKLDPEYIALGPVYPTILKKMPWAPQGLDRVTHWKSRVGNTPLVGIGGLSLLRAQGVFDAGADVVALVTDITLNTDPEQQVREWIKLTQPYR
jgi:thiamine-phosphate pyrophosphorylase